MVNDNPNIIMTGFVQGKELEELYSNCYLYCLPSDVEGMPLSLLEAMSYGCECLASDIEENKQVIDKYGYSFKKADVKDLKDKLTKIIEIKKNNEQGEISNYIEKKYNWNVVVEKTIKLYEK